MVIHRGHVDDRRRAGLFGHRAAFRQLTSRHPGPVGSASRVTRQAAAARPGPASQPSQVSPHRAQVSRGQPEGQVQLHLVPGAQHGQDDRLRRQGLDHAVHRGQGGLGHRAVRRPRIADDLDLHRHVPGPGGGQRGPQHGQHPVGLPGPVHQRPAQRGSRARRTSAAPRGRPGRVSRRRCRAAAAAPPAPAGPSGRRGRRGWRPPRPVPPPNGCPVRPGAPRSPSGCAGWAAARRRWPAPPPWRSRPRLPGPARAGSRRAGRPRRTRAR